MESRSSCLLQDLYLIRHHGLIKNSLTVFISALIYCNPDGLSQIYQVEKFLWFFVGIFSLPVYLIMTADINENNGFFCELYDKGNPKFVSQTNGMESFQLSTQGVDMQCRCCGIFSQ